MASAPSHGRDDPQEVVETAEAHSRSQKTPAVVRRTLLQMLVLIGAAFAAGFVSNALRPSLEWGGNDPLLLKRGIDGLSVQEAARYQDDPAALYLDVRPHEEYEKEHVRGAIAFSSDDFGVAYEEIRDFLGPGVKLLAYADATLTAVQAAEFLEARGHTAWVIEGGWKAWKKEHLPTEEGP
jgi:rhodanese-related sulfurtransferase